MDEQCALGSEVKANLDAEISPSHCCDCLLLSGFKYLNWKAQI